jgi:hypothetical protein
MQRKCEVNRFRGADVLFEKPGGEIDHRRIGVERDSLLEIGEPFRLAADHERGGTWMLLDSASDFARVTGAGRLPIRLPAGPAVAFAHNAANVKGMTVVVRGPLVDQLKEPPRRICRYHLSVVSLVEETLHSAARRLECQLVETGLNGILARLDRV